MLLQVIRGKFLQKEPAKRQVFLLACQGHCRRQEVIDLLEAVSYAKHLYADDLEGYLQVAHIPGDTKRFNGAYVTGAAVPKTLGEMRGQVDCFITPNSFYIPERASRNIRHFRSLFIDLDLTDCGKAEAVYEVTLLAEQGIIPEPTMIVDSGRGIHLYWRIQHAPMGAAWTWQELEDYLYRELRHLGADGVATDSARLLRIPGTINSRNGAICKPILITDKVYSMYDLREKYLSWKPTRIKPQRKTGGGKVTHLFNPYTLHKARLSDLLTLCRLRNYDVRGCRNTILHLYAYWQGITMRDTDELATAVHELNDSFKEPLKPMEVVAVVRCTPKAIEAFLEPEAGPRSGHDPQKGPPGYNYNNETLLKMLKITEKEQQQLKTIIGTEEKYRRSNERRTPRNEAGLTPREQQKLDTVATIKELRVQGLTIAQIADEVGLTAKGVQYHLYK